MNFLSCLFENWLQKNKDCVLVDFVFKVAKIKYLYFFLKYFLPSGS